MSKIIDMLEKEQMKTDLPAFAPGDTVVVQVKVTEGLEYFWKNRLV